MRRGSAARSSRPSDCSPSTWHESRSTRRRRSRSGSTARAARRFSIETSVGVLWLLAGVVAGALGIAQLVRGASFPWRRSLILLIPIWIAAILADLLDGRAANMTGVFAGSLELAVPITLGAFAGILSERSGLLNIAIEGKFLIGACAASIVASVTQERADRHLRGDRRGRPGRAAARVAGDPLQGRPDHLGRRRQHRCPGHHELPVPARPVPEHRAEHAADGRGDQGPAARRTSRSSVRCCSPGRRTSTRRSS